MSTAKKTGHGAAWANLIVCGGISWAVSLWHAMHSTHGTDVLAILVATAPVVTAAFASHHVVKRGAGWPRRIMTCLVFAMGMSMSIKAQAVSVAPVVGGLGFGVVFALMLDVSAFLALGSIMKPESGEGQAGRSTDRAVDRSTDHAVDRPADRSIDRPADHAVDRPAGRRQTVDGPSGGPSTDRPADRPKATRSAPAKPHRKATSTRAKAAADRGTVEDQVRLILAATPEMRTADVARKLGRDPGNGTVKMACAKVRTEMQAEGAIEAPAELRIAN
jgi:hypothetical protein